MGVIRSFQTNLAVQIKNVRCRK